jgi:hypothetical protein
VKRYSLRRDHEKRGTGTNAFRKIRPDAQRKRKAEQVTAQVVMLAPGVVEMRGVASLNVHHDPSAPPYLDSLTAQREEAREMADGNRRTDGVDQRGLTRGERAAWSSVLRGFALALLLLGTTGSYPAAAVRMIEPTLDANGNTLPATGALALKACKVWLNGSPDGQWIKPSGKPHPLPEPADWHALPWTYAVACCNGPCDAANWGPMGTGTLNAPVLTTP